MASERTLHNDDVVVATLGNGQHDVAVVRRHDGTLAVRKAGLDGSALQGTRAVQAVLADGGETASQLPPILDIDDATGSVWMPLLPAVDIALLQDGWRRRGQRVVDVEVACALVAGVLTGLASLHRRGLVHGDLAPGNIGLDVDGTIILLDVDSVSSAWAPPPSSGPVGTLPWMAPEHVRGEPIGPPADVYAAGVLLAELLLPGPFFGGLEEAARLAAAGQGGYRPPTFQGLSQPVQVFLEALLTPFSELRPSAAAAAERCAALAGDVVAIRRRLATQMVVPVIAARDRHLAQVSSASDGPSSSSSSSSSLSSSSSDARRANLELREGLTDPFRVALSGALDAVSTAGEGDFQEPSVAVLRPMPASIARSPWALLVVLLLIFAGAIGLAVWLARSPSPPGASSSSPSGTDASTTPPQG